MFEAKALNPLTLQLETVLTLPGSDESEAMARAEEFFLSQGIKIGELVPEGSAERGKPITGFQDQESSATQNGGFWFVANHIYFVFKYIREVLGLEIHSFIDLGCGPGNILISAKNLLGASELTGVEIDPALVRQAKDNTRMLNANIIQADLLEWVPAVNDYDMVYIYEPIRDENLRLKFLSGMTAWLKDGQYVFFQRMVGDVPEWFRKIDIPNYEPSCLYTFDKSKA